MSHLQILADENIPLVEDAFGHFGTVETRSGREIVPSHVRDVDVLLVRSVTLVGRGLLEKSNVRFVGSATTGTDHVDEAYLREQGIQFVHAPGSNADSVGDYIIAALLELAFKYGTPLSEQTVGIVGCGNIGSRLARRLSVLGVTVLKNDPPLARAAERRGEAHDFVAVQRLLTEADAVTLHVPLTREGPDATHHLANADFFDRLGDDAWILNASRGPVVDSDALLDALRHGSVGAAVLDVWENEPSPSPDLIRAVEVATPHIAGYAYDGKVRGTAMLYKALCRAMDVSPVWEGTGAIGALSKDALVCTPPDPRLPVTDWLVQLARQAYDIRTDDASLRRLLDTSEALATGFTRLRRHYRRRREMQQHRVPSAAVPLDRRTAVTDGLSFQLQS